MFSLSGSRCCFLVLDMKLLYTNDEYITRITSEKSSDIFDFINPKGSDIRAYWIGLSSEYRYFSDGSRAYLGDALQYSSRFQYGNWNNSNQFREYLWKLISNSHKEKYQFEYSLLKDIARAEYNSEAILVSNRDEHTSEMMVNVISSAVKYMIKNSIGIDDLIEF